MKVKRASNCRNFDPGKQTKKQEIMKNFTTSTRITFLSLVLFSTSVFGIELSDKNKKGETPQDGSYCIEIDGKVLIPKNDDSKLYRIELLCHNDLVDSGVVVDDESFLLKVKKNSWYTIRIIKEGYFTQVVSIDTRLPEYVNGQHKFHFDTELIVENYASIQDEDAIDFPIAIISFNPNKDRFVPVREYSKNIKSSLFDQPVLTNSYAKR
jgi:hypothetical protein